VPRAAPIRIQLQFTRSTSERRRRFLSASARRGQQFERKRENGGVLLLFDIDGTLLLRASSEHAAALHEALALVYGTASRERVFAAGRTDTAIARDLAALGGVSPERFDAGLDEFKAVCAAAYAERCPASLGDRLAPGMAELLAALSTRDGVRCSLVTGNYEPVARLKLERAGIGHHFAPGQGGFGSDAEHRDELPPIARARAGGYPRERTIVIGDTPLDIACARSDGLRVLAVATGPYPPDDLADADAVAADGWELRELLERELRA
jgi:phosphoglycolate phosphatase-like HAD superfamily hydrolase